MRYRIVISLKGSESTNQDTFILKSIFETLPSHQPRSTARKNATFNDKNKDYRFGPIRIDWLDLGMSKSISISTGKNKESARGPAIAKFYAKEERRDNFFTNLPQGVIHVFREGSQTPEEESIPSGPPPGLGSGVETDGVTLGILAVPSWMTPSDLLSFISPAAEGISHLRIIRDSFPNRSIAVIHFPVTENAVEFAEVYNGKAFNSLEPEICHVVHVSSLVIESDDTASPTLTRRPSVLNSMYELPTCPVCLERMDSAVTGLITVPCSHTFHCLCLSKWGDSRCPVCRYSQTLRSSHPTSASSTRSNVPIPFANPSAPTLAACSSCSSTTNLWICLICGNVGCGRYGRAHAYAHYELTTHLYALELETQRVWDYAGDGYVHRLIQNKADGKLVELPSAASSMGANSNARDGGVGPSPADALTAEKIEAIGIEYSYLLTSQLDSQRAFYEEQANELKCQVNDLRAIVEQLSQQLVEDKRAAAERQQEQAKERESRLAELVKDKAKAEARAEKKADQAREYADQLNIEKMMSAGLLKKNAALNETVAEAVKEKHAIAQKVKDMEDQLRDVMFFLEARDKIEAEDGVASEAQGGSLEIVTPPIPSSKKKKKKPRK